MIHADQKWMARAIALARRGRWGASPNPWVGCVIVKNGRAVGEGAHLVFGGPHAEANALKRAGARSSGACLYVNLEPCVHWGKTPPCTEAIIRAGIRRVVAAMSDPNPLVNGRGFKRLTAAGIQVVSGVMARQAKELNRAFIKTVVRKKPYVILKSACSLDGKIAAVSGDSRWITSGAARRFGHGLRAQADAVLIGGETVRLDDPSLTSHGRGRDPVRVVLAGSGRLPESSKIFHRPGRTWVFCGKALGRAGQRNSENQIEWIKMQSRKGRLDFDKVLKELARRGISRLLIEGGGETAACALESGEVDEVFFFLAPILIGGGNAKTAVEGRGAPSLAEAWRLTGVTVGRLGPDLLVHGRIAY